MGVARRRKVSQGSGRRRQAALRVTRELHRRLAEAESLHDIRNPVRRVEMGPFWVPELADLARAIRFNSSKKGFKVAARIVHEKMLLAVGEICEAQEELRNGHGFTEVYYNGAKPEGFPIEIADAIIRLLDLCAGLKIDIVEAIRIKCEYNTTRPRRHGRKF